MELLLSLIQPVLAPILGGLLTFAGIRIKRIARRRPCYRVWSRLSRDDHPIRLAIPSIESQDFPIAGGSGTPTPLPRNVNLVALLDAMAVADLRTGLGDLFAGRVVSLHSARHFNDYQSHVVAIGGSSVNSVTHHFLFDRELCGGFDVRYPDHVATANGTEYVPVLSSDQRLLKDYGFIIVFDNPLADQRSVTILQGIWPHGTWAAVYALLHPRRSGLYKAWKRNRRELKTSAGFFAVVECLVVDELPGTPRLIDFCPLP